MVVMAFNEILRIAKETAYGVASVAVNELQTVTVTGAPTGGSFTLTLGAGTTGAIPWNASAKRIQDELEKLVTVGQGNLQVTGLDGGPWVVTFIGSRGGVNQALMTATPALLGGTTPGVTVVETLAGAAGKPYWGIRARPWSFRNQIARVFPDGERTGTRSLDTQASVPGRVFANGQVPTWFRPDTGGMMLLGALGSEVVIADPVGATVRKKHTLRCTDLLPSHTLQSFQGQVVTAVDQAMEHLGCMVDTVDINWDASQDADALEAVYGFIGKRGTYIAKPPKQYSDFLVQPTWKTTVTRDGVSTCKVQSMQATLSNGIGRVKGACGTQEDQELVPGGRSFRGTLTLIYDDETEYQRFEQAGEESIRITMTDTSIIENVGGTDYYGGVEFWIPRFTYETYNKVEVDGYYAQEIGFRAYHDESIGGPVEIDVWNGQLAY